MSLYLESKFFFILLSTFSSNSRRGCRVAALALDEGVLLNLFQGFEFELIDHLIFIKESVLVKTGCV